jgi:hypothetical protein
MATEIKRPVNPSELWRQRNTGSSRRIRKDMAGMTNIPGIPNHITKGTDSNGYINLYLYSAQLGLLNRKEASILFIFEACRK